MRTLRQLTRSRRENGGSRGRSWRGQTHKPRVGLMVLGVAPPLDEESPRAERIVESLEHRLLQPGLEVNEDVAATDEIEAREWRVAGEVVAGEDAHLADGFADLVVAAHFGEEAPQAFRGNVPCDV